MCSRAMNGRKCEFAMGDTTTQPNGFLAWICGLGHASTVPPPIRLAANPIDLMPLLRGDGRYPEAAVAGYARSYRSTFDSRLRRDGVGRSQALVA